MVEKSSSTQLDAAPKNFQTQLALCEMFTKSQLAPCDAVTKNSSLTMRVVNKKLIKSNYDENVNTLHGYTVRYVNN